MQVPRLSFFHFFLKKQPVSFFGMCSYPTSGLGKFSLLGPQVCTPLLPPPCPSGSQPPSMLWSMQPWFPLYPSPENLEKCCHPTSPHHKPLVLVLHRSLSSAAGIATTQLHFALLQLALKLLSHYFPKPLQYFPISFLAPLFSPCFSQDFVPVNLNCAVMGSFHRNEKLVFGVWVQGQSLSFII